MSKEERTALEELVRKRQTLQQLAKRGRMILGAADGKRNVEIARELGGSAYTMHKWRTRWIGLQAVINYCSRTAKPFKRTYQGKALTI